MSDAHEPTARGGQPAHGKPDAPVASVHPGGQLADFGSLAAAARGASLLTDPDLTASYRWDRANDPSAGMPLAVARVSCTEDVQEVVRFAARHAIPWCHAGRAPVSRAAPRPSTAASWSPRSECAASWSTRLPAPSPCSRER